MRRYGDLRSTGEVAAVWDYVSGVTPTEPTYPAPGGFVAAGALVAGPNATTRFKLSIPIYVGYTYEVYGNPTLADLAWKRYPFPSPKPAPSTATNSPRRPKAC